MRNSLRKRVGIKGDAKILLCFGISGSSLDYMRDLLISALATDASVSLCIYPNPFWQLKDCSRDHLNTLYGRGFSCTATLDSADFQSSEDWQEIAKKLVEFDAVIACTSSNHGFGSLPDEVQETLRKRSDIVWVDGNDIDADHDIPACANRVFRREMNG